MATPLPKLSVTEWHDVKDLASTISSYAPGVSRIRGQTTIQVLTSIKAEIDNGQFLAAGDLVDILMRREAYNAYVGIEGKRRRQAKR